MSLLTLLASNRRAICRRIPAVAAVLAYAAFSVGGAAKAQTTADPPNKPFMTPTPTTTGLPTTTQSPVNPFPYGGGDAQNRSWAAGDPYWGVLDGNLPDFITPVARFSDYNAVLTKDGWTWPRLADPYHTIGGQFPLTNPNGLNQASLSAPLTATAFADGVSQGTAFTAVVANLPSTGVTSTYLGVPAYYEAGALPRPASNATSYDITQSFIWRLDNPAATPTASGPTITIPGNAGAQTTYRIFVHIPTPNAPVGTTGSGLAENRIDDARYIVYYYVFTDVGYLPRQQVCYASQVGGGNYLLRPIDGSTLTFPLLSSATFTGAGPTVTLPTQPTQGMPTPSPLYQGVEVDNTTTDSTSPAFVLADSVVLEPNNDSVQATPTITPQHGGSFLTSTTGLGTAAAPVQTTSFLPDSNDANYNTTANRSPQDDPNVYAAPTSPATRTYSYVNDINDTRYNGMGYNSYVPWNPSTTFQGPASLIDPRYSGTDANGITYTGAQVGLVDPYLSDRPTVFQPLNPANPIVGLNLKVPARAIDATNNNLYTAPYFSHAQVLIAKTSFVQDPEYGIPDSQKTGTKTISVSAIYALDWQTGAPVWRFPDRTYLPEGATLNGKAIYGAGLRNPSEGTDLTGLPVFLVPGIVAVDRNGDGIIQDDEVYIGSAQSVRVNGQIVTVNTGSNTQGGINASVTLAPRVLVQGNVTIPYHDPNITTQVQLAATTDKTDILNVQLAPAGRYYNANANDFSPVPVGMAFIAAGNGVMYAVDAYGNNDTKYYPGTAIPVGSNYTGTYFGTYQAGTTNLFWTFTATNHAQLNGETKAQYYGRLGAEIPGTSGFGASAPVLSWNYSDSELSQHADAALRLFVGNTNGVLYAMDPNGSAGYSFGTDPKTGKPIPDGVQNLPFIKGAQTTPANYYGSLGTDATLLAHQADLAWWFRADGSINYSPAVSLDRQDQSAYNGGPVDKGVYVSSAGGHVFCVDWMGPFNIQAATPLIFDGGTTSATNLNNDIYNHQIVPTAALNNVADGQQGMVRPRWVFPNLYRSNMLSSVTKTPGINADNAMGFGANSGEIGGVRLAEPSALGPIQNAPMLMDFWWKDPDVANSVPVLRNYVVVVANDPTTNGFQATESRVYLLDQIGDRTNYLTNPRATASGTLGRVISQPRDKFSPKVLIATTEPTQPVGLAWSYRFTNEAFPANGTTAQAQDAQAVQLGNTPIFDNVAANTPNTSTSSFDPSVPVTLATNTFFPGVNGNLNEYMHQPTRRMLPTVFIGGLGIIYGIDIDPETGLFMRWRPTVGEQSLFTPLETGLFLGTETNYPGNPATTGTVDITDQVLPVDFIFNKNANGTGTAQGFPGYSRSDLATQTILARQLPLDSDATGTTSLTISGGPVQNRDNFVPEPPNTVASPSVPLGPTNDVPTIYPFKIATIVPATTTTLAAPPSTGGGTSALDEAMMPVGTTAANSTVDYYGLTGYSPNVASTGLTLGGHKTGAVNQDINDPMTPKRGAITSDPQTTPPNTVYNASFTYPILFASTAGSWIHGVSSNIEGNDRESPASDSGVSQSISWGFVYPGNTTRINSHGHTNLFDIQGPGGLGGIAVFSNAYYPALDPYATGYRNKANGTSLNVAPNLIADEPNTTAPTPTGTGGVTVGEDANEARPDFKVRPLILAQAVSTASGAPVTAADYNTGQTGFPLDLNGHFFDRQFAGAGGATQFPPLNAVTGFGYSATLNYNNDGQHPLGDYHVWLRLPGYSNIGTRLANTSVSAGLTYTDTNNQVTDGARVFVATTAGGGTDAQLTQPTGSKFGFQDIISDDINPAGQNVAWIYSGGDDGTVYAFTPAIAGHDTGFAGGVLTSHLLGSGAGQYNQYANQSAADQGPANGSQPQIDLFAQGDFQNILNSLNGTGNITRSNWRQLSVAAQGGKNYYEWGDTAYIIVYDVLAEPATSVTTADQPYVPTLNALGGAIPQGGIDNSIVITLTAADGSTIYSKPLSLAGVGEITGTTGGNLLAYYRDNNGVYQRYSYAAPPASGAAPLGIAVLRLQIGVATGVSTPGTRVKITVHQNTLPASFISTTTATNDAEALLNNPAATFAIANPLAVQGFMVGTAPAANGQAFVTIQKPSGGYNVNSVGPLESSSELFPGTSNSIKAKTSTTIDPNMTGAEYWQALTNGNQVVRSDDNPYLIGNNGLPVTPLQINPTKNNPITPTFYLPVISSTGYINHGTGGSTASGNNQQSLRIANRSLLQSLASVRVLPSTLLFRAWPGTIMNAVADATANPRLTPGNGTTTGMADSGQINPLPWEVPPSEARPFSTVSLVNTSPDYPDVAAIKNNAVQVIAPSGDLTLIPGSLATALTGADTVSRTLDSHGTPVVVNNEIYSLSITGPTQSVPSQYSTYVSVTMPKYQPANLVAAHNLTSTYIAANPNDFSSTGLTPDYGATAGPLQLPRGVSNRILAYYDANGQVATTTQALVPFGYTSHMFAFVDSDRTGSITSQQSAYTRTTGTDLTNPLSSQLNPPKKAYREFEVWSGVPVDQSMSISESIVHLGALPQGFGMENGLLGYNPGLSTPQMFGLIPPTLSANQDYNNYFKNFTLQNTGNTNFYNLRASQKVESNGGTGSGTPFRYFQLQAKGVDPNFGIAASGADPYLPGIAPYVNANVMPQMVTSLDQVFDAGWDTIAANNYGGLYGQYYHLFGGRHVSEKATAGAASPSVFGIPALPGNETLIGAPTPEKPRIALAVPIGTPYGTYSSSSLTVFEDHDTNSTAQSGNAPSYQATPVPANTALSVNPVIVAAGPLYSGQNRNPYSGTAPAGNTAAPLTILSNGGTNNNGVFRAESFNASTNKAQPLPFAYPYLNIQAQVTESALTSQFPDLALISGGASITSGLLPYVDASPVVTTDTTTTSGTTYYRPASALTPASWRDAQGNMHVYFSRNSSSQSSSVNGSPYGAMPGAPYQLSHTMLAWDAKSGSWKANTIGSEISTVPMPNANGHWFSTPVTIPNGSINSSPASAYESNTSPSILTHGTASTSGANNTVDQATLFFLDTVPLQNGSAISRLFYVDVTSDGVGGTPQEYFLNPDPTIKRFAPRAVFDSANSQDFLMYYGGTAGRWGLYYVPRTATKGLPSGTTQDASTSIGVEHPLPLPSAIVSATEPSPVYRTILDSTGTSHNIVDVYYTGISRATQSPDLYMNRYEATPNTLTLLPLPGVVNDPLAGGGRQNLWRARNIAWIVSGTNAALPTIKWTYTAGGTATNNTTAVANWKYDSTAGLLYQTVGNTPATLTYVFVDASAGTVRFRGGMSPSVGDSATASYTPQVYRLTSDGAGNYGSFDFQDPQTLPATPTGQGSVLRRLQPMLSGRSYLFWQKGALAGKAPTLYFVDQRVGIDLANPVADPASPNLTGVLANGQSIQLSQAPANATATADQTPLVSSVTVNGSSIPYDVDFNRNRIYVEPQYENLPVDVVYTQATPGAQSGGAGGAGGTQVTLHGLLTHVDELNIGAAGTFGAALPMVAGINEGQVAAMIDLLDPTQISGFGGRTDPPALGDPSLLSGRVWVFWTSPRGRTGQAVKPDMYPTGYNLYWETLAPDFDGLSLYTPVTHN